MKNICLLLFFLCSASAVMGQVPDLVTTQPNLQQGPRITEVRWAPINSPLDNNPASLGGGNRIFPDKKTPADDIVARPLNTVQVVVTTENVDLGTPVYFRLLDVDDPSDGDNPSEEDRNIDSNGLTGDDNRHPAGALVPQATLNFTTREVGEDGRAIVMLSVEMQPGNNYRVAASLNQQELNSLTVTHNVNGGNEHYVAANNTPLLGFNGNLTPMLTVWRRLHLEIDAMRKPAGHENSVVGHITEVRAGLDNNYDVVLNVNLQTDAQVQSSYKGGTSDFSAVLENAKKTEDQMGKRGRFENGTIRIGSGEASRETTGLFGNGVDFVRTDKNKAFEIPFTLSRANMPPVSGKIVGMRSDGVVSKFTVKTEDATPLSPYPVGENAADGKLVVAGHEFVLVSNTDQEVTVEQADAKLDFVLNDDDQFNGLGELPDFDKIAQQMFEHVYIFPYVDGGDGCELGKDCPNNRRDITFERNTSLAQTAMDFPGVMESRTNRSKNFWIVNLLRVFQHTTHVINEITVRGDKDPFIEKAGTATASKGQHGAIMGVEECFHEGGYNSQAEQEMWVHEIGHCFALPDRYLEAGNPGSQPILTGGGIMENNKGKFAGRDQNTIRNQVFSPGRSLGD